MKILIILLLPYLKNLYILLTFLQQESYNVRSIFKYLKYYYLKNIYFFVFLLSFFYLVNNYYLNILVSIFLMVFFFIPINFIKPLKITKRSLRIIITSLALYFLSFIIFKKVLLLIAQIFFLPFVLFLTTVILLPLENLINKMYQRKALKILKLSNPFIIEITGSYGKTTLKNIIYNIYKPVYLVLATPKSYNTRAGITKTIINDLKYLTQIFIVEAGARRKGDIEEITKMVRPNVGVITSVGYQHLETFKSIDNVLKTKWELATSLSSSSSLVLNYDSLPLDGLTKDDIKEVVGVGGTCGIFNARHVCSSIDGLKFSVYEHDKFLFDIETKLKGVHNVDNILLAYAVKRILDKEGFIISDSLFKAQIEKMENPDNRLKIKKEIYNGLNLNVIDDSYNSNVEGFSSAVNLLKSYNTKKAIITPGLVEMGSSAGFLSEKIALALEGIDLVLLIDHKEIKELIKILEKNKTKYLLFSSFKDAKDYLLSTYQNEHDLTVLYESDLPDYYLKR